MNVITPRPGAVALYAPAPPALPGKVLVRRVHGHVPLPCFASGAPVRRAGWIPRLLRRYPTAVRKVMGYLRTEGPGQTWLKIRTRATLERWDTTYGAFAAVGVTVEGTPTPGATVVCWSWQGAVDAEYHLVAQEQCLPVPDLDPEYAFAPFLGWIVSALRRMDTGIASCRLIGLDPRLQAPLEELLGSPTAGGRRVVVGCGSAMTSGLEPGEFPVYLSDERAVQPLVTSTATGWVCRLPDPMHYFLDPYYPGPPEMPEPFGRPAVEEALDLLARRRSVGGVTAGRAEPAPLRTLRLSAPRSATGGVLRVSCVGAGNYVRAVLLHHLRRHARVLVRGVMDIRPEVAVTQARALKASFCTTDPGAIFADGETDLVLVASDHASHADYAVSALRAGKAVHLEKPPAVSLEQLERLLQCLGEVERPRLHLGYNRPFAPAVIELQRRLEQLEGPTFVTFVVKGYRLGRAHWYNWPNQGTRIAGNLVHWIDLGYRLTGRRLPVWVEVTLPSNASALAWDPIVLSVGFDDGALMTISFSSAGDETYGIREYVDVKKQDLAAEIEDFRSLRIHRAGRQERRRYRRDKGHAGLMATLARRVLAQEWDPQTVRDMARTSAIQFAAQAALAEGGGRKPMAGFLLEQAG